jgi:phosphopantetheinyl transferase
MATPLRRLHYEAGRALMRFALQRWTGRPADSLLLRCAPGGKPECLGGPPVSVSHSGHFAVCAIARAGRVGVDIQFPVPRRRTSAIAEQYFSPDETEWQAQEAPGRFYMLWVLKEAYLKAAGLGIAGGLDLLRCRIAPPGIEAQVARDAAAAHLALYTVDDAFLAVATLDRGFSRIGVEFWSPDGPCPSAPPSIRLVAATNEFATGQSANV